MFGLSFGLSPPPGTSSLLGFQFPGWELIRFNRLEAARRTVRGTGCRSVPAFERNDLTSSSSTKGVRAVQPPQTLLVLSCAIFFRLVALRG